MQPRRGVVQAQIARATRSHAHCDTLRYDEFLDQQLPRHGNWQGLSLGQVLVTWLAHILSEHDHFMSHVQDWALRQFKAMPASLDPLGVLVGVDVVAGNQADDGLYVPMLARLRTTLPASGLLYIGDSKMGALATRAYLHAIQNSYLMPLAQVGQVPEQLAAWVDAAVKGKVSLETIRGTTRRQRFGEGYEIKRHLTVHTDTQPVDWVERVLIVRSDSYTQARLRGLQQRLTRAQTELRALTPARGRGRRQFTEEEPLRAAIQTIWQRYEVAGLWHIGLQRDKERRPVRAYGGKAARVVERDRLVVTVTPNAEHIKRQEQLPGWRVYVTNAPVSRLSLNQAIRAYRDENLIERNCARLKGRPLSLRPAWVSREDH